MSVFEVIMPVFIAPLVRATFGWAENAFKDKKITNFELAQLGGTYMRVGLLTATAYFGLEAFGINGEVIAAASAITIDFFLTKINKVR